MSDGKKYIKIISHAIMEAIAIDGYAEVKVNDRSVGMLKFVTAGNLYGKSLADSLLPNIATKS